MMQDATNILRVWRKQKIFVIGRNKTGTTSIAKALRDLGFRMGDQRRGELLLHEWARRDFRKLVRLCRTAQAFQDAPFSYPFTFQALDAAFPGSKFVLSVRSSSQQWYRSVVRYHSKLFGKGGIPTADDLRNADYCYRGFMYEMVRLVYGTKPDDLYDEATLIDHYEWHNRSVMEYFRGRERDLLVLDVAQEGAHRRLCEFVGRSCDKEEFPWELKTDD